jgi:glycosyltransferase involved in cell wall biosynthesis
VAGRVALVVLGFPRLSESFIFNKFAGLLRRGWDAHVVCSRSTPGHWRGFADLAAGTEICSRVHAGWPDQPRWRAAVLAPAALALCLLAAPRRTLRYLQRCSRKFGMSGALRRLYHDIELVRLGPDLVHFEFGALAPERMDLKDFLGCRIVVSFRGYDINYVGLEDPAHYESVWKNADGLHFLGNDLWRRARRRGCPPDRLHALIPPAIDTDFFRRDSPRLAGPETGERELRILSVGRLEWKKGYEHAFLAIRMLLDRGVRCRYRILGDGEYLSAITFVRYQLGLEGVVELLGAQPREDVKHEMQNADVLLHAAVSEGFANAVVEAQAMELPVVCTDADGLPENVADGETGFVVPRRNARALADKVEELARDPSLRLRMGQAGRRRVLEKFRLDDQIDRFEALYRRVMDGAGDGEGEPLAIPEIPVSPPAEVASGVNEP